MKLKLIDAFIVQLQADLVTMKDAARAAHEAATHEESKAENQYDTRGLEASYLAGAQAKRAAEIDEVLALFKNTSFKIFDASSPAQATALVDIRMEGKKSHLLMMPKGGALRLRFEGRDFQIITPQSSLGEALIGLHTGDWGEFEISGKLKEFEVLGIS